MVAAALLMHFLVRAWERGIRECISGKLRVGKSEETSAGASNGRPVGDQDGDEFRGRP